MAEWIYRATPRGATVEATVELLEAGFLCRTAYATGGSHIANVTKVVAGDVLHLVYRDHDQYAPLGAFRVMDGAPDATEPADPASASALVRVASGSDLEASLRAAGYEPDPSLMCHVGWCIEEVTGLESPDFDAALRGAGQNALHRFDSTAAQVESRASEDDAGTARQPHEKAGGPGPSNLGLARPAGDVAKRTLAVGVDWSGAAAAGKKIWQAHVVAEGEVTALARLDRPFLVSPGRREVVAAFPGWFAATAADVVGLDFCFGVARSQLPSLLLAAGEPGQPPSSARELGVLVARAFDSPDAFREACGREVRRDTDRVHGAPFAPTNLRMYRQTWLGLTCLGTIGSATVRPGQPGPAPVAIEVLPAKAARTLGHKQYKGRSPAAQEAREALVTSLEQIVQVSAEHHAVMIKDSEGDAIDAVLAALEALNAHARSFTGAPPSAFDEGWIY